MSKEKNNQKKEQEVKDSKREPDEVKKQLPVNSLPKKAGVDLEVLFQFVQSELIDVRKTIEESKNEIKTVYERMDSLNEQFVQNTVIPLEKLNQSEVEKFEKLQSDYEVLVDVLKAINDKIAGLKNETNNHASWQSVYDLQAEIQTVKTSVFSLSEEIHKTNEKNISDYSALESELIKERRGRRIFDFSLLGLIVISTILCLVF